MSSGGPIIVGHYRYTATDARKTLGCLDELWLHHRHQSVVPDGWLAGARGFVAEAASLAAVPLPSLEDLDGAFISLSSSVSASYDTLDDGQIEALLAAIWRFFPTMRMLHVEHAGSVAHLHASKGLPKKPVEGANVGWTGVDGDVQSSRVHHGRPWQALCLWSTDAIDRLRAEGHPIDAGFAGENITVDGIPSAAFRPGAHFRAGSVRGFLTAYAIPCSQNAAWFRERDFERMSHERGDESRVYAMVTAVGTVRVGDRFELFTDR